MIQVKRSSHPPRRLLGSLLVTVGDDRLGRHSNQSKEGDAGHNANSKATQPHNSNEMQHSRTSQSQNIDDTQYFRRIHVVYMLHIPELTEDLVCVFV